MADPTVEEQNVQNLAALIVNQRRMGRTDAQITTFLLSPAGGAQPGCATAGGCPNRLVAKAFLLADKTVPARSSKAKWWMIGLVVVAGIGTGAYFFGRRGRRGQLAA